MKTFVSAVFIYTDKCRTQFSISADHLNIEENLHELKIIVILLAGSFDTHSSDIRRLCLMKLFSEILQNFTRQYQQAQTTSFEECILKLT